MRKCQGCTSSIADNVQFCPICGMKQEIVRPVQVTNRFCTQCGIPLAPNVEICQQCGARNLITQTRQIFEKTVPDVIKKLSTRILLSAIAWICVSALQLLCALIMVICFLLDAQDFSYLEALMVYGVLGCWNMYSGIADLIYLGKVKRNFIGIIYRYRITVRRVALIIYNLYVVVNMLTSGVGILALMGLVALAAIAFENFGILLFIHTNKNALIQLENSQIQ